ncbi:MAG: site-2 protease family protein [Opitutales bacterium]
MKWSLRLGSVAGIGVFLHWPFSLLIIWVLVASIKQGQAWLEAVRAVGFVLAIFGCVVLHELGHALTARRYGIDTQDIVLLPIGGVARLERMPQKPMQEFWVAIAGPAVNAVIALALLGILALAGSSQLIFDVAFVEGNLLARLLWVNVFIGVFNLLPAFPMDGGRILRALLSTKMRRQKATNAAASLGQVLAVGLGFLGFLGNPILIFIAIFIYLGAEAEAKHTEFTTALEGLSVKDGMQTRFRTLQLHDTLAEAVDQLLAGSQVDFPVLDDGRIVGMLSRQDLIRNLAERGKTAEVSAAMTGDGKTVDVGANLVATMDEMHHGKRSSLPVVRNGELVGLLTSENVSELVMVRNAQKREPTRTAQHPNGVSGAALPAEPR